MIIERDNDNIVIRLNAKLISLEEVQKFADYFRVLESNSLNKGTEEEAAALADEVDKKWWTKNKSRFLK
ncbi:MAG TPA: hypothetical protein VNX40_04665 [Mucilaginibacter sp.]|jgi:hypothetical protein|nr:hypothetical protein [Mucilaginibacter sp.]